MSGDMRVLVGNCGLCTSTSEAKGDAVLTVEKLLNRSQLVVSAYIDTRTVIITILEKSRT